MHIEYEVRVLEIDKDELVKKIEKLGAKKIADFNYKRRIYNFNPAVPQKWIRLRTDGNKTTLTIKKLESLEIDGTKEMEIEVLDFEELASDLKQSSDVEKLLVDKILNSLQGDDSYDVSVKLDNPKEDRSAEANQRCGSKELFR